MTTRNVQSCSLLEPQSEPERHFEQPGSLEVCDAEVILNYLAELATKYQDSEAVSSECPVPREALQEEKAWKLGVAAASALTREPALVFRGMLDFLVGVVPRKESPGEDPRSGGRETKARQTGGDGSYE